MITEGEILEKLTGLAKTKNILKVEKDLKEITKNSEFGLQALKQQLNEIKKQTKDRAQTEEEKKWEGEIEKICEANKIFINAKDWKKIEQFEKRQKEFFLLKLNEFANSSIQDTAIHISHFGINVWKEKSKDEPEKIFTQKGQAMYYLEHKPMFYDKSGMWWLWNENEKRWVLSDEVDILNIIEEELGEDIITSKKRQEIINSLKQEGRKHIPEPIKPTWIQFRDKIVDIQTGEISAAIPKYFVTNPIPWKLHNNNYELTPNMDRIFEEWVGEKYIKTLYEIIAYCLLPSYPIHRLFCFIGAGLNGKTCFLRLLRKFIGRENTTTTELNRLTNSRFEVTRLHKKLACLMGETNFTEMKQTALIKSLTGQDEIPFEYKNKTPFSETNYAKIIIATNNLPTTTDKTLGWYRRWCIIDFPNQFSEEKDILEDIPEEEYESLALKCVNILHSLTKNKKFHNEGTIQQRMEKYEEKSDFLQKFLDEFTEEDLEGFITKNEFFGKFKEWCIENRHRILSEKSLGMKMKHDKMIKEGTKSFTWMNEGRGGTARIWVGVRWKE